MQRPAEQHSRARQQLDIGVAMSLGTVLVILLILFLVGALPTWRHSSSWGYFPSGGLGIVLLVIVVLVLAGRI
jgi:hypothetical protein